MIIRPSFSECYSINFLPTLPTLRVKIANMGDQQYAVLSYGFTLDYARRYDKGWNLMLEYLAAVVMKQDLAKSTPCSVFSKKFSVAARLSEDLIFEIMKFMDYEALLVAEMTCKLWQDYVLNRDLWNIQLKRVYGLSANELSSRVGVKLHSKLLFRDLVCNFRSFFNKQALQTRMVIPADVYFGVY